MTRIRLTTVQPLFAALMTCASTLIAGSWDYPVWSKSKDSDTPLFRFVTNGAAGYIDRTGKIVVPAHFRVFGNHEYSNWMLSV
jgi:hypothetical protein